MFLGEIIIGVELKGIVDSYGAGGKFLAIKGLNIDISQAKIEVWQSLQVGHFIKAEGWLVISQTPLSMKAVEIELKGVG